MEYVKQVEKIKDAIESFKIDKLYIDATRGEMEERGLPRECVMIKFTGKGNRSQASFATGFAKRVENNLIELLNDDRFISQIICVNNDLDAPETAMGHGDSFVSVGLAIGAYDDCYDKNRIRGAVVLGDMQELVQEKKIMNASDRDDVCKICNKRTVTMQENGKLKCTTCLAEYELTRRPPAILTKPFERRFL
jgi:hypothetical protein